MKGSILEENIARTVGSIGESVAAGAIFTIPAFVISGAWPVFDFEHAYWKSSILMLLGGVLGILFVTLLRRVMVEDPELPFPESVAASQIHIAGQQGSRAAKILFGNMGFGGLVYLLGQFSLFSASRDFTRKRWQTWEGALSVWGATRNSPKLPRWSRDNDVGPCHQPGLPGRGLHHRAAVGVAELCRWRHCMGPAGSADSVPRWTNIRRAVRCLLALPSGHELLGGTGRLLSGASSFARSPSAACWSALASPCSACVRAWASAWRARSPILKKSAAHMPHRPHRRDLNGKFVFSGLVIVLIAMVFLYKSYADAWVPGIVAAIVMMIVGFFFAAVSGNLVGIIGSSNNPISGLTLAALVIAAILMVLMGVSGMHGVAAVLGVAAVVCISSAVAGEMLQDLKVGHILGGTPVKDADRRLHGRHRRQLCPAAGSASAIC